MNTVTITERSQAADLASESVAGEEDPGACIDMVAASGQGVGASAQPASRQDVAPGAAPSMSPGDQAPAGTPGTGEDLCRLCGGNGQLNGGPCPDCEGTGKITEDRKFR